MDIADEKNTIRNDYMASGDNDLRSLAGRDAMPLVAKYGDVNKMAC